MWIGGRLGWVKGRKALVDKKEGGRLKGRKALVDKKEGGRVKGRKARLLWMRGKLAGLKEGRLDCCG